MKLPLCQLALLLSAVTLHAAETTHTKETLAEIKKAVDDGNAVIVDVREQDEWADGHVLGAVFMPLSAVKRLKKAPDNLPKDKPLYVHCAAGVRSLTAATALKNLGLDARALKPGYEELTKSGFAPAKK